MAAVQKQEPEAINERLAYMFTIIRAAQESEEPAWRSYDEAFREKAAATGNRKWSDIDSLIYTTEFSQATLRKLPPAWPAPVLQIHHSSPPPPKRPALNPPRSDICYLFNSGSCGYDNMCKFRHTCSICSGRHPQSQ